MYAKLIADGGIGGMGSDCVNFGDIPAGFGTCYRGRYPLWPGDCLIGKFPTHP